MMNTNRTTETKELFENRPVASALMIMAVPTVVSQIIALIYNVADTWFIGQTNNPYMIAASSLVLTIFLITTAVANLFGVGGGSLVVRLLGKNDEKEASKVASLSLVLAFFTALLFSLLCLIFMNPILHLLGASDHTITYARQYLLFVVIIGGLPTVLSNVMSTLIRNIGYSKEAGLGLGMGGVINVILDPLFMFIIFPDGYEVTGAAFATMLSNMISFSYFMYMYKKLSNKTILSLPHKIESVKKESLHSIFSVGIPSAISVFLYDLTNIVINKLTAGHGDTQLAAMGIVLKIERLPLNIGIGICLGMMPLIAYNYASKNHTRMKKFFTAARFAGITVSFISVVLYYIFSRHIVAAFIQDVDTVKFGTEFLKARCFATPFMFLSFHMVHFMQAIDHGKVSFYLAIIRQLCLNIPILLLMNHLFGMSGIIWTQMIADCINSVISYIIYMKLNKTIIT